MSRTRRKGFKFEKALEELESVVERLSSEKLDLDQMLDEFERGIKLYRACKEFIDQAQKKVEMLVDEEKLELKEIKDEAEEEGD